MTNEKVAQNKKRIEDMLKYYHKGFGNLIQGSFSAAEAYLRETRDKECYEDQDLIQKKIDKTKEKTIQLCKKLKEIYATIPFEDLKDKPDFAPLLKINELLPKYQQSLDDIISFPNGAMLDFPHMVSSMIITEGEKYRRTIEKLRDEIRKFPKNQNFSVKVNDEANRTYSI